jgi:23S rRNA pseudouridine2457 synthase
METALMPRILLFNKPYGIICQFSPSGLHPTLKDYIDLANFYPAGRLDTDSEGLLLLTDDGRLQHRISDPRHKWPKVYWVQVEGVPQEAALARLRGGVRLPDVTTRPAEVRIIPPPRLWERHPPVRFRKHIPTTWLELSVAEGKYRQVRRMTAAVGLPTLRLVRWAVGSFTLEGLASGEWRIEEYREPPISRAGGHARAKHSKSSI